MFKRMSLIIVSLFVITIAPRALAESWAPALIDGGCYDMTGNPTYCNDQTGGGVGDWWNKWFGGGNEQECPKTAGSCTECRTNCECQFEKNKKQCNNGRECIQLATLENEACMGGCLTDYDGC
ncbi:MAG TPA: hypothetical protein VGF69_09580 [Thermoanaerobaculia bacterium]|jgi:hypothetical protein